MKKIITLGGFSGAFLCILFFALSNASCTKPTDCKVQVTVVDSLNQCVNQAVVELYSSSPPGQVDGDSATNIYGIVDFDFKLPAIFNVQTYAIIANTTNTVVDTIYGTGIIQLQPGETEYITITAKTVHHYKPFTP